MTTIYAKDPNANLDYGWDWSAWLAPGDTIVSHSIIIDSGDVILGTHSNTTTTVTAWFSGGTVDTQATVTARITTAQGRIDDRSIILSVEDL